MLFFVMMWKRKRKRAPGRWASRVAESEDLRGHDFDDVVHVDVGEEKDRSCPHMEGERRHVSLDVMRHGGHEDDDRDPQWSEQASPPLRWSRAALERRQWRT